MFCCILIVVMEVLAVVLVVLVEVLAVVLVVLVMVVVDTFYPLHTAVVVLVMVLAVVLVVVKVHTFQPDTYMPWHRPPAVSGTRSQVSLSASDSCLAWTLSTQASCQFQYQSV